MNWYAGSGRRQRDYSGNEGPAAQKRTAVSTTAAAAAEIDAEASRFGLLVKVPPSRSFPPGFQNALFSLDRKRPVSLFSRREKRNGGF